MQLDIIQDILRRGEGLSIEFKQAKTELPKNLFETVCAFLNREGDIFETFVPLMTTKETTKEMSEKELEIISLIIENKAISAVEIALHLGMSADGVRYYLKKMKNKGVLSRKGPTKGGEWKLLLKRNKR